MYALRNGTHERLRPGTWQRYLRAARDSQVSSEGRPKQIRFRVESIFGSVGRTRAQAKGGMLSTHPHRFEAVSFGRYSSEQLNIPPCAGFCEGVENRDGVRVAVRTREPPRCPGHVAEPETRRPPGITSRAFRVLGACCSAFVLGYPLPSSGVDGLPQPQRGQLAGFPSCRMLSSTWRS